MHKGQGHDLEGFTLHGFSGTFPGKSMSVGPGSPATSSRSRSWSLMSLQMVAMETPRFLHRPNPKHPNAAFWPGRYRADACWKTLTGLWVSATSPVVAGADCCGVSCPSLCRLSATTSAELYSHPSKLGRSCPLPPVCPARSPPLPGKKSDRQREGEMEG